MKAPRRFSMVVTLEGANGQRIDRPVTLTAAYETDAKHRAGIVAPKPGQRVIGVAVKS